MPRDSPLKPNCLCYPPQDFKYDENQFSATKAETGEPLQRLNRACIRRFMSAFCIMYRNLALRDAADAQTPEREVVERLAKDADVRDANGDPVPSGIAVVIRKHHCLAGSDAFSELSQRWDVHLGGTLAYIHEFPGMYNAISQVRAAKIRVMGGVMRSAN